MVERLAYRYAEAAEAAGVSENTVRRAIDKGTLTPRYISDHPVIDVDDLREWIKTAPTERPASQPTERASA
jgi:hypothetical protein